MVPRFLPLDLRSPMGPDHCIRAPEESVQSLGRFDKRYRMYGLDVSQPVKPIQFQHRILIQDANTRTYVGFLSRMSFLWGCFLNSGFLRTLMFTWKFNTVSLQSSKYVLHAGVLKLHSVEPCVKNFKKCPYGCVWPSQQYKIQFPTRESIKKYEDMRKYRKNSMHAVFAISSYFFFFLYFLHVSLVRNYIFLLLLLLSCARDGHTHKKSMEYLCMV